MRASILTWVATLAIYVPWTVAEAAPAQERPRYYFPRHVKRQLFSNSTVFPDSPDSGIGELASLLEGDSGATSSDIASPTPFFAFPTNNTSSSVSDSSTSSATGLLGGLFPEPTSTPTKSSHATSSTHAKSKSHTSRSITALHANTVKPHDASSTGSDPDAATSSTESSSNPLISIPSIISLQSPTPSSTSSPSTRHVSVKTITEHASVSLAHHSASQTSVHNTTSSESSRSVIPTSSTSASGIIVGVATVISDVLGGSTASTQGASATIPLTTGISLSTGVGNTNVSEPTSSFTFVASSTSTIPTSSAGLALSSVISMGPQSQISFSFAPTSSLNTTSTSTALSTSSTDLLPTNVFSSVSSGATPTASATSVATTPLPGNTTSLVSPVNGTRTSQITSATVPTLATLSSSLSIGLTSSASLNLTASATPTAISNNTQSSTLTSSASSTTSFYFNSTTTASSVSASLTSASSVNATSTSASSTIIPVISTSSISSTSASPSFVSTSSTGISSIIASSATSTTIITSATSASTSTPYSIVATGTNSATSLVIPTSIEFAPTTSSVASGSSEAAAAQTSSAASGLPTAMPRLIQAPGGLPKAQANFTLIQIGFNYGLNYPYVVSRPNTTSQIFAFLPQGVAYGLGIPNDQVIMNALMPYDTSSSLGFITTLAQAYVPNDMVTSLEQGLHAPNGALYTNPHAPIRSLMGMINPTIPLLPGATVDTSAGSESGGQETASSETPAGDGAPIGGDSSSSQRVSGSTVGIGVGAVAGAAVYAAAMVYIARRYRQKRRQRHQRNSSVPTAERGMSQISGGGMGSLFMSGANGSPGSRDSGHSSNGRSVRDQGISNPITSENSLGWN